jgi:hypothetical protein
VAHCMKLSADPSVLMRPALAAHAAGMYAALVPCSKSARRVAVSAASRLVDTFRQSWWAPDMIRRQAEVTEHGPEGLPRVGSVQELLPHLNW